MVNPLINRIKRRVLVNNKNFGIIFIGATGSGKSYSAMKLAEELDPTFNADRIAFTALKFMEIVNNIISKADKGENIKGKVIMWDEFGVEHNARSFMSKSNRVVNYFFQTARHYNLVFIMTVPFLSLVDSSTRKLFHAYAQMEKIDPKLKVGIVKIKMVQVDPLSGKEYPKYLRVVKKGHVETIKRVGFALPSQELINQYENNKKDFTRKLNLDITGDLTNQSLKNTPNQSITKPLTEQQQQIYDLTMQGKTYKEIAEIIRPEEPPSEASICSQIRLIRSKGIQVPKMNKKGNKAELTIEMPIAI